MTIFRMIPLAVLLTLPAGCDLEGLDTGDTTPTDSTDNTDETDVIVEGCADLCAQADSSGVAEGACVSQELQGMGYDVVGAPRECAAIAGNETGCLACMTHLGVSDEDCVTVEATCL